VSLTLPVSHDYNACDPIMASLRFHCASLLLLAHFAGAQALAPYEPANGCYLGAYIEKDPKAADDIAVFEALTNKKHASYFHYVGYGQPFPFEWANKLKAVGAMPHIAWEPNDGLGEIRDDAYLQGWAQACAYYQAPILLRFASEMNGDWEAYSGDPDLYIRKWRLVYSVIHSVAPNVIMCWCPFATPKSTIPLYYPGDAYVDWVGVNAYSVMYNEGNLNKRAVDNAVQHLEFIYNLYADRKPIAVCEYAATHHCGAINKPTVDFAVREMRRMYETIETRFPRVRMINWFSVDTLSENLAHNDYALTNNEEVLAAYRQIIASPHFLSRVEPAQAVVAGAGGLAVPGTTGAPGAALLTPLATPGAAPTGTLPAPSGPLTPVGPLTVAGPVAAATTAEPSVRTSVPLALSELASPPARGVALVVKGAPPAAVSGRVNIEAVLGSGLQPDRVSLMLDGQVRSASNAPPYFFSWNTERATVGEHRVRVIVRSELGEILAEAEAAVVVAPRP
jgi:hypothetical protein